MHTSERFIYSFRFNDTTCTSYTHASAKIAGSEEIRTFYSSLCVCDLGYKDNNFCNGQTCGICCAVKSAFKSFAFGETSMPGRFVIPSLLSILTLSHRHFHRFGQGIYSYRNPFRAHRFSTSCTTSPFRVIIACDTVVLPGQVSDENDGVSDSGPNIVVCNAEFDNVNEDSIFTPIADGILPAYVIMYTI